MDRETELNLIDEALALNQTKTAFLGPEVCRHNARAYTDPDQFKKECERIFRVRPVAIAHVSELTAPGDFVSREHAGLPVLLIRDADGSVNAFLNICRHRGARLVNDDKGCKKRFVCPYHAWTYGADGALVAAPHFDAGFPDFTWENLGLERLACVVRFGFVWVSQNADQLDEGFTGLDADLDDLGFSALSIIGDEVQTRRANWKILVEGGLEAYHFRIAHCETIGPYFADNLSTYQSFGPHLRSVLFRRSLPDLGETPREAWRLRDHAHILYTIFPASQFLVMPDHVVWIASDPRGPGETGVRIVTLADMRQSDKSADYWRRNHDIAVTTLNEDFDLAEQIQANAESGGLTHVHFGRFESALTRFNETVAASMT